MTAEAGQDFAFLSLAEPGFDLSDRGVAGRPAPPPVDVFVTTERGAYRPGETVFATVLARDDQARAVEGLTLTAIVTRADGVEYGRFRASRPGCRRPGAGAADRRGRSHRRLAARGPCRPGGAAAGDGGVPGRGLHAGAGRSRADPARGAGRPGGAADASGAGGLPLGRRRGGPLARGRDDGRHVARAAGAAGLPLRARGRAFHIRLRGAAGVDDRRRWRGADPAGGAGGRAGEPAAGADRDAARARRVGAAGRAQRDAPAPAGGAADRGAPALRRRGGRGRDRRLRGDRPRARSRARGPRGRELVAVADRDRLPVVRGGRRLELRAGHAAEPGGERDGRPRRRPRRCGSTCPWTGAATS